MKKINLYNNKGIVIIDNNMHGFLSTFKWHNSRGYANNIKIGKMHRYIMNCPEKMVVDHINGNTLDNRKCNLRICTQKENSNNKHKNNIKHVDYIQISILKEIYQKLKKQNKNKQKMYILLSEIVKKWLEKKDN